MNELGVFPSAKSARIVSTPSANSDELVKDTRYNEIAPFAAEYCVTPPLPVDIAVITASVTYASLFATGVRGARFIIASEASLIFADLVTLSTDPTTSTTRFGEVI